MSKPASSTAKMILFLSGASPSTFKILSETVVSTDHEIPGISFRNGPTDFKQFAQLILVLNFNRIITYTNQILANALFNIIY